MFFVDHFLSEAGYGALIRMIRTSFTQDITLALSEPEFVLSTFEPSLTILSTLIQHPARELPLPDIVPVLPDIFVLAYVLQECYGAEANNSTFAHAKETWGQWEKAAFEEQKNFVWTCVKAKLRGLLCNPNVRLS